MQNKHCFKTTVYTKTGFMMYIKLFYNIILGFNFKYFVSQKYTKTHKREFIYLFLVIYMKYYYVYNDTYMPLGLDGVDFVDFDV